MHADEDIYCYTEEGLSSIKPTFTVHTSIYSCTLNRFHAKSLNIFVSLFISKRYVHAIYAGTAITYFTEEDLPNIKPIANLIQAAGGDVPEFIRTTAKFERQPQRPKKRKSAPAAAGNAAS